MPQYIQNKKKSYYDSTNEPLKVTLSETRHAKRAEYSMNFVEFVSSLTG